MKLHPHNLKTGKGSNIGLPINTSSKFTSQKEIKNIN